MTNTLRDVTDDRLNEIDSLSNRSDTMSTHPSRSITVASGRAFRASSQWGYTAQIDQDGYVTIYDDVAGHYTTCHALTARQIAYIRRVVAARQREE